MLSRKTNKVKAKCPLFLSLFYALAKGPDIVSDHCLRRREEIRGKKRTRGAKVKASRFSLLLRLRRRLLGILLFFSRPILVSEQGGRGRHRGKKGGKGKEEGKEQFVTLSLRAAPPPLCLPYLYPVRRTRYVSPRPFLACVCSSPRPQAKRRATG